jgi:hypothetical protein
MTRKELKSLKSVCSNFVLHTLYYGQEVLTPTGSGITKIFQHSKSSKERILQFSARYNGDEIVFLVKAYWTPTGIFWWPTETYNMTTRREMRSDAARNLLYDLTKRARIKTYDTSNVKLSVDGDVKVLICEGHEFNVRQSGKHLWVSKEHDPYWVLADTMKEAKIQVHQYVTELAAQSSNINP